MKNSLFLGLDVGSTTVKLVCLRKDGSVLHQGYRRHYSDVCETLAGMVTDAAKALPATQVTVAVTGSAGMGIAQSTGLSFVQEVIASTTSIRHYIPRTSVAIELGGEDAKITFFEGSMEQRMNETCAGGTGAFIDQMASYLETDAAGLDALARNCSVVYPIASRCGVFAKTDIMPLLNEGAAKADIAASIFQAVVDQTISGLACGRAIKGNIAFLGGPLHFLPELRNRFILTLGLCQKTAICPDDGHYYVALGAALEMANPPPGQVVPEPVSLDSLARSLCMKSVNGLGTAPPMPPLFTSAEDLLAFRARHAKHNTPRGNLQTFAGNLFLGFDIGSTTFKATLIDSQGSIYYTRYAHSQGDPLPLAVETLQEIYALLPAGPGGEPLARIAHAGVTGYGAGLIRVALKADLDEVETVAHYRAARHLHPEATFVLDIGGQDMKCLHVSNGIIDRIMLNEACSAGCGVFVETFAKSLDYEPKAFVEEALLASRPVDLGSRCTVFMNSRVKQAQKEGASVGDIAAGLAYSVIRNALYKVIKAPNVDALGPHVVAQGGAFINDALLKAFELLLGREIYRPDIAGLMGAYGAALLAKDSFLAEDGLSAPAEQPLAECIQPSAQPSGANLSEPPLSGLIAASELGTLSWKNKTLRCSGCGNRCLLTSTRFTTGQIYISGNRCETGQARKYSGKKPAPNLLRYKYRRLFDFYTPRAIEDAPRGRIGLPRALNMFENYPFWFTFFTQLGFRVELSAPSDKDLYALGAATIPSQTVCYPAKLAHGHIMDLVNKGVRRIFFPCIPLEIQEYPEADNQFNCPVVSGYPDILRLNMDALAESGTVLRTPFLPLHNEKKLARLLAAELTYLSHTGGITQDMVNDAVRAGNAAMNRFRKHIQRVGARVLGQLARPQGMAQTGQPQSNQTKPEQNYALVLAGHPYHIDPGINHGIADMIAGMGIPVLTEDCIAHLATPALPLRVVNQWTYHARLYRAATLATQIPNLGLVQITSFGCGLDAVTADQVQEILERAGRVFTLIKIDEGANLGAARIRIRSLLAAEQAKQGGVACSRMETGQEPVFDTAPQQACFTKEMRDTHTLLVPQFAPIHFRFVETALALEGYKARLLPSVGAKGIETGLTHVNNDMCYPAQMVIGQLLDAIKSGVHDPHKTALVLSQTGGSCRASNYIAAMHKALHECGLSHIPVVSFNISGMGHNPGFEVTTPLLKRIVRGTVLGDLLSRLFYRTRPYEVEKGHSQYVLDRQSELCLEALRHDTAQAFAHTAKAVAQAFAAIPIRQEAKPRVGVVGEIYLQFNPEANNNVMDVIEAEGGEAVPADMVHFFQYSLFDKVFQAACMAGSKKCGLKNAFLAWWVESTRKAARKALAPYPQFGHIATLPGLIRRLGGIFKPGHQAGEGWLLTAEMVELLETGVQNILCLQPFACLPNHITGKGVVKTLKQRYPMANIAAVDYDAGASEVNQLNRIKLMMAVAHRSLHSL